jgi:arylformamidase
MKKLCDISPPVDAHSPVFPGDTPYTQQWAATLSDTCPVNVSAITMSPHVGAHADAPLHYLPPRVLVRTYRQMPLAQFDGQLTGFDPVCVQHLADLGVLLIGTDSASIDPAESKQLPSHQVIRQRGLRVLENLLLDDVPEGDYELIALPLKLMTADASPVRATATRWA